GARAGARPRHLAPDLAAGDVHLAARGRRARVGARPVGLLAARVLVGEDPGVGLRPDVRGPARRPAPRRGGAAAWPPPRAPPASACAPTGVPDAEVFSAALA